MNLSTKLHPKSWAITVRCRSKGLDFRMNMANVLPNWGNGGERISLFLGLKRFLLLTVESEFGDSTRNLDFKRKEGRLRRFWGSLGKLFGGWKKGRKKKKGSLVKGKECGNSMREESWYGYQTSLVPLMGSLSLLSHSSAQRDHKGILIYAFSYILYLVSFFRSTKDTRISSIFIPILVCIAGLYFSYLNYGGFVSKSAYLGSSWICSLAFVHLLFSKLIPSMPLISIERKRMMWCLLIAPIAVLLYNLRRKILLYLIKIAFFSSQAWIAGLILTTQAFFQTLFECKENDYYAFGALLSSAYFWGKEMSYYLVPLLQITQWLYFISIMM